MATPVSVVRISSAMYVSWHSADRFQLQPVLPKQYLVTVELSLTVVFDQPGMPTRNVNLTEELDRFVLAKVESGPALLRIAPHTVRSRDSASHRRSRHPAPNH